MKKVIWGIVVIVVIVLIAVALSHSSGGNNNVSSSGPIKLGVILPLTGDAASYGEPARNVYQLAADEINQAGGINGNQIQLIVEDGKCSGQDAASAAQKLINVDQVQMIVGGFCSSESLSVVPVAEGAKVAVLSPGSSSPDLTGISKFFARNYPSDASQGVVLADIAYNKEGIKKVAFLQEQLDYPLGIYNSFSTEFEKLGGTVVKEEFPTSNTDFRSQLTKLRSDNADALFVDTQTPASADRVFDQIIQIGWKPRIIMSDVTIADPATVTKYSGLLENGLGAVFGVDESNPKLSALEGGYKTKYNTDLPYPSYAQTEYDGIYLAKDAITAAGYDGTKISNWLHTNVNNWQGASGSVTIGSNGDLVGGHKPEIVQNGQVVPYTK